MFIGHQTNWQRLTDEAQSGRHPPAYLFYGSPGIGKKLVAQTLAQWFVCKENKKPCGTCPSCTRVAENRHPDFFLIAPDEAGSIKIDPLRNLQKKLMKAPLEAPLKIVVMDQAGEMTPQAQNSILKVLEEPPPRTLFILIAPALYAILPTIRSRSRLLFFSAPPLEETAAALATDWGTSLKEAKHLLEKAEGSPGLALRMRETSFVEAYDQLEKVLGKKSFAAVASTAQNLAAKEVDISLVLEIFKKTMLQKDSGLKAIDKIKKAQGDIDRNVNRTLVLENLLMDL